MEDIKETIICAAIWGLFGFSAMGGAKAADWLIPNPPGTPVKVEIRQTGTRNVQPAITEKRPYLIG